MKIIIAAPPGRFSGNRYPCPFPSRWTSLIQDYPIFIFFPYELAYLSTLLKRDLPDDEVKMIDGTWLRFTTEDYIKYLEYEKPDWVVFEADTVTYGEIMKIAGEIKKRLSVKIIMTGQYATIYPQKVLEDGNDFACIGEYEETVRDILKGKDPKSIDGLYPKSHRQLLDIDSLPDPEDDDISRIGYSYAGGSRWTKYRSIEVHASRGCPYSCDFCVAGTVYYEKPNWRMRSSKRIINEIETMRRKYNGIEGVFFNEETHIVKKRPILEFCDAIIASGNNDLHYEAMANHLLLDEELLEALSKAGYYKLRIGIETIDEETSKSIGRKTKPDRLLKVLTASKKLGIEIYGTFIIGASGSTREGDEKTIEYGKKLLSKGLISSYQASIAVPHPGTPFYEKAVKNGWLKTDSLESFNGISGSVLDYPKYNKESILKTSRKMAASFEKALPHKEDAKFRSTAAEKNYIPPAQLDEIRKLMPEMTSLFNSRQNAELVEKAKSILKKFPKHLRTRHMLATAYERLGKFDDAGSHFTKIIMECDDYDYAIQHAAPAHFHLGWMSHMDGKAEEALTHFKECMHLNPNHQLARRFYWILEYGEDSKKLEGEYWNSFEKEATCGDVLPLWVDLQRGAKVDSIQAFWSDPEIENILRGKEKAKLISAVDKPEIKNILEIGSGSGWLSLELARKGKKVTGIDLSSFRIELASKTAKKENLDIRYIETDVMEFCESGEKFDAIVAWDSLHHIHNLEKLLKSLKKMLVPNGLLAVYDHLGGSSEQKLFADALLSTPRLATLPRVNGACEKNNGEELSPYEDVGSFMLEEMIGIHFEVTGKSFHVAFTPHITSVVDFNKSGLKTLEELQALEEDMIKNNFIRGEYIYLEARNINPEK